jgi:hypothetical protein
MYGKITTDVGIVYHSEYMEFMNTSEVIPDLKEKRKVDTHYILVDGHKRQLMISFKQYIKVYLKFEYKNDMNMGDLYIKYRVSNYRGEDFTSIIKEIDDTFLKIHDKYVILGKILI